MSTYAPIPEIQKGFNIAREIFSGNVSQTFWAGNVDNGPDGTGHPFQRPKITAFQFKKLFGSAPVLVPQN